VLLGPDSPWRKSPPPVVLFISERTPRFLPELNAEVYSAWSELLTSITRQFENSDDAIVWTLSPEADVRVGEFCRDILRHTAGLEPFGVEHFDWCHELVIRLAMLFMIWQHAAKRSDATEGVITLEAVTRACCIGYWLMHEHYNCLKWLYSTPQLEVGEGLNDVMEPVDMDRVRLGILRRLRTKGPLTRRELSRSFHELSSRSRDVILFHLKKQGLVTESDDGKLEIVDVIPPYLRADFVSDSTG
jgi:hypothetical protein